MKKKLFFIISLVFIFNLLPLSSKADSDLLKNLEVIRIKLINNLNYLSNLDKKQWAQYFSNLSTFYEKQNDKDVAKSVAKLADCYDIKIELFEILQEKIDSLSENGISFIIYNIPYILIFGEASSMDKMMDNFIGRLFVLLMIPTLDDSEMASGI